MFINSYNDLHDYIFRQLGSEQHRVEISDQNFLDIYNRNVKYINNYVSDAVNEKNIMYTLNNERELYLADNIIAVTDIVTSVNFSDSNIAYPGINAQYDFLNMNSPDTSAYLVFVEQLHDIRNLFRKRISFRYNSETKTLILDEAVKAKVIFRILETEDISYLYDMRIFLLLLERDCWKQWLTNVGGKYLGSSIGNGILINSEYMKEKYKELDELIKQETEDSQYEFLAPFKIN